MPNTKNNIKASRDLKRQFPIHRRDQWYAMVLCLQEWQASGTPFNEYLWETKLYPHAYNMATKMFPSLDRTDEKLIAEATVFTHYFAGRLRGLYADVGKGEAFIRRGIPPVEPRPIDLCTRTWLSFIAISILTSIILVTLIVHKNTESTSSSSSSFFPSTSSPRPLSPERAVILKDFQVALEIIPSLAVRMTSTPTGAPLSSSSRVNDSATIIVSLCTEIIELSPTFFTQLDDLDEEIDDDEAKAASASTSALPISRARRAIFVHPNPHTRLRNVQIRARETVTAPAKMQSLLTRLSTELDAIETLILNFLLLHSRTEEAEEEEEDKKDAAQQLLNTIRNLRISTSLARYSISKIHNWISDLATNPLNRGSSSSSFASSSASPSSASGETPGAQSPPHSSPASGNNHGATPQQPHPSSLTLTTALADINSTIDNWTVQARHKDQFLYRGSLDERFIRARQGGFGAELVEDIR
ncbi:MAG: hypothetical protein L6R42_003266 [Xanthoria sp. 1 TBL-2021]|nr:MAG: hypothetical protein L6R42_003266 [Xanthoria sp. 1 TBL-2021]